MLADILLVRYKYVLPCIRIPCVNAPSNALKLPWVMASPKEIQVLTAVARILIGLNDSKMKSMSVVTSQRGGTQFHQV